MTDSPDLYAILELMGRQTIAGKVSEYSLGGTFVRVRNDDHSRRFEKYCAACRDWHTREDWPHKKEAP